MGVCGVFFFLMVGRPPRSTQSRSSAASDVYKRQASASCTSQVPPETFREILGEAARRAGRRLLILHEAGQPADHPVPAHFPEARYLKFILGRLLSLP